MLYNLIIMAYAGIACLAGVMLAYITVDKKLRPDVVAMGFAALAVLSAIFLSPHIYILFALMFLVCPVFCRKNEHIAGILIIGTLLTPDIQTDLLIGGTRLITFGASDALGLGAIVALFMQDKKSKGIVTSDLLVLAMAALLIFFEARGTSATNLARITCQISLNFLIPCWVVTRSLKTENDLRTFMMILIGAGCILSSFLIMESIKGWPLFREALGRYDLNPSWESVKWRYGFLRASGPFSESTSMAFGLLFSLMAAWNFKSIFSSTAARYAVVGFLFIGISTCQSRNAYLGLMIGIIAAAAYRKFHKPSSRAALFASALLLVAAPTSIFLLAPSDTAATSDTDSTTSYRAQLLKRGLEEARKAPITGTDINSLSAQLIDMKQGEHIIDFVNSYLYVTLLSGIIGLIIFCSIIFYTPITSSINSIIAPTRLKFEAYSYTFSMSICTIPMLLFTFFGGRIVLMMLIIISIAGHVSKIKTTHVKGKYPRRNFGGDTPNIISTIRHES